MQFLDRFDRTARERLMAAGRSRRIDPGGFLIRRGERGGDIYYVEEGAFEVVDTRSSPEVVLNTVGPGAVLGEMAFIDAAPRGADVRASSVAVVRVWDFESLQAVLGREPEFAANFYKAMAETTVGRLRGLSASAISGTLVGRGAGLLSGGAAADQAHGIAAQVQARWLEADVQLRRDPGDPAAQEAVRAGFSLLLQQAGAWLRSFSSPVDAAAAGAALSRELRPYLVRSELAQLCLEPPAGRTGHPRQQAHVVLAEPDGEGGLGGALDACLLSLPTSKALRERTERACAAVVELLPTDRPARVALVNAAGGALLTNLASDLAAQGATVVAIDGSREALAFLDAGLPTRSATVKLKLLQQDLTALAMGRAPDLAELQDFVMLDALFDYLPDRLAAALLGWTRRQLAPDGVAILFGLAPSPDASLFDHVLRWPMVRRGPRELAALAEAAGLTATEVARRPEARAPGVVLVARATGP